MKKYENLTNEEKDDFFYMFIDGLFPAEVFRQLGVKYDEDWERKCNSNIEDYFKKYHPSAYKKGVQLGYKIDMGATLGAVPKGYVSVKKADIIAAVAKKTGQSKKAASETVNAYWDVIKAALKSNKKANINIPNVGSIRCVTKSARTYSIKGLKNTSKKSVKKAATTSPKFFVSDNFLTKSASEPKRTTKKRKKTTSTASTSAKSKAKAKTTTAKEKAKTKAKTTSTSKKKSSSTTTTKRKKRTTSKK